MEQGHVQHAGAGWKGGPALPYHTYVDSEGASMNDAIWFSCVPLPGQDRDQFGTDVCEASDVVSDESNQGSTNRGSYSDLHMSH